MTSTGPRHDLDRRQLLRAGSALAAGGLLARLGLGAQTSVQTIQYPQLPPAAAAWGAVELDLVASAGTAQIRPGAPTAIKQYTGTLRPGSLGALATFPGSHLGPILYAKKGDRIAVQLDNQLVDPHIVHWHGLDVPAGMDGHPQSQIPGGATFQYRFRLLNRAGSYWFHPHTDMLTAEQVYAGMAGLLIVSDDEEQSVPLPRGPYDVPLVVQDCRLDAGNQLVYTPNAFEGFLGDTVLVNGIQNYVLSAATRVYRFRVYNASVSRIYKLVWSDGTPVVAIGNDGGLLPAPRTMPYVMLSPGERVELWADFRNKPLGAQIMLRSVTFLGAGGTNGQNPFDLARVSIDRVEPETLTLPTVLSAFTPFNAASAVNYGNPRLLPITLNMGSQFVFNGAPFQMGAVAANEIVRRNQLEILEFTNTASPAVAHPVHLHGRPFQVLLRQNVNGSPSYYNAIKDGYVDQGWKDTVLLWPGERIQILMQYTNYTGLFLYHCHNLVHEDMGMMRNLRVDP